VRPRAVIFDMDGLMLDTEPLAARAWVDAAAAMGIAFDAGVCERLIGRNAADCREIIVAHHGRDYPVAAMMQAWLDAYDAIVAREGIALKPGLGELIAWLEEERIAMAVATSTRRVRALAKLVALDLDRRFAALVGGDEVARGKPAPDIYREAVARIAAAPAQCVALEDSEPGVRAALAADIVPIMVPDRRPPSAEIGALGVLVCADLARVRDHLARLPVT
jgi:HAD superfamily hydrolase (TIGR01509 family)